MVFRRFAILTACCCLLAAAGCELTSAQRVELYRVQLEKAQTTLTEIQGRADQLAADLDKGLALVQDVNLPVEDRQRTWQQLQKVRNVLTDTQATAAQVRAFIAETQARLAAIQAAGPVDVQQEFEAVGGAVGALGTALGGPVGAWAPVVAFGISVAGWIAQALKSRKLRGEKQTLTATAGAIVRGVEAAPAEAQTAVKAEVEAKMKAAGIYDAGNAVVDQIKKAA